MSLLSPREPSSAGGLSLRQTNGKNDSYLLSRGSSIADNTRPTVSNPSIVEYKPSVHSVTASEDYYSLSGSSTSSDDRKNQAAASTNAIHRYVTPPSRYRTPAQSRDQLQHILSEEQDADAGASEIRKTPMRGEGKRRQSAGSDRERGITGTGAPAPVLREGGVRRKPVPSIVIERNSVSNADGMIDPSNARSSVARELAREGSPETPGQDDTPFLHFALDQLTRDEEVRGSRRYRGLGSGMDGNYAYIEPAESAVAAAAVPELGRSDEFPTVHQAAQPAPVAWKDGRPGTGGSTVTPPFDFRPDEEEKGLYDESPPPKHPRRYSELPANEAVPTSLPDQVRQVPRQQQQQHQPGDTRFLPVWGNSVATPQALNFLPGILRPLMLIIFLLLVLAYMVCLIFCAAWSLAHTGLWAYGSFGDGRYFVFQYLPTLLGIILFFWTIQIQVAVFRIAPFVAMSSTSPREREAGARLPLQPEGFVLPYFGHFGANMGAMGFFVVIAWLQLFTLPLLASSFNVYYVGASPNGEWKWIATQGAIWTVIALYLLLLVALVVLMASLKFGRKITGLKWDPRSLADLAVLMERSNALDGADSEDHESPMLGYWRTNARPTEIFYAYGVADKDARHYSLEDGRIREKIAPPTSRFLAEETHDLELGGNERRHSREKMLPDDYDEDSNGSSRGGRLGRQGAALPWFLHPSLAALWIIIALVLVLAFLVVSYLPSIRVRNAFAPDVSAPVNTMGFSATNFLYSIVPAFLGTLCLLFWLDIDYAYRRLAVYEALGKEDGELAERSLLLAYPAEVPFLASAKAAVNGHWRVALVSFVSLIAATLPILGGGVFWALFYVSQQRTLISAEMKGYYALTVLGTLYALSYLLIFPSSRSRRTCALMGSNPARSFADTLSLMRRSRMLDDIAFHSPVSKIMLVTRLLSAPADSAVTGRQPEGMASKASLADSVRGYGRARQQAIGGMGVTGSERWSLGRHTGRDGGEFFGIGRVGT